MCVPANRGKGFLEEFKTFLAFLQGLWGILTGISIFFPLSNVFFSVIPLKSMSEDGALACLSPAFITATATLATLFVILWTFSNRGDIPKLKSKAWISFLIGIFALVSYVVIYELKLSAFDFWGWESDAPYHLLIEIPLLVTYAAFFVLTTRAFILLGLLEFYRETN